MATATVQVGVTEENITDINSLTKDSCCIKCFDLEIKLRETMDELSSARLIIELLKIEVGSRTNQIGKHCDGDCDRDTVKLNNIQCKSTEMSSVKARWSDSVAGRNKSERREDAIINQTLESNITSSDAEEQWKTVNTGRKKPPTVSQYSYYQIPVIVNQYELLRNKGIDKQMTQQPLETHELKLRKESRSKVQTRVNKPQKKEKKHRIVIIGDSHARGCAGELKSNLDADFEIQGFINPGTGLKTISTSAKREIQQLSTHDVVVMWGGSKDMGRNETKQGINWIQNFVETNKHTNIILMEVPHRYDLIQDSCVNKEVARFNHIIRKRMKAQGNVEVMKVNVDRRAFTKHGQHMNVTGKEMMAKKMAEAIMHILEVCKKTPIILK